jgi:hypothetical protein
MQHRSGAWAIASDTVLGKKSICFDSTITKIFRHKCCITHTLFFSNTHERSHILFFFFFFAKLRLSELMLHTSQNFENEEFLLSYNILCHISDMKGKKKLLVPLWRKRIKTIEACLLRLLRLFHAVSYAWSSCVLPIHGQSCCTTRHDTNTTKHDTIRHEHYWTRLPFMSCSQACKNLDTNTTRRASCRVVLARQHDRPTVPCQHEHDSQKKISSETIFSSIQHSTTQIQSQFTNSQSQNITEHHRDNTEHHRDNFFKFELVQWLPH